MQDKLLEVRKLNKSYGNLVAVDNLDLQLLAGETLGFLGPNGAGKTTSIAMIAGLLKPDTGEIRLGNKGSPADPRIRLMLGYVPQELAIYDNLSARENLHFFGSMTNLQGTDLKKSIDRALELARLKDRARDPVEQLSGGMKRRLNLAVALLHRPRLLLLDEPTAGVDPQSRNSLLKTVEELRSQGHGIIYTTHYMEEAQKICTRVGIMDKGRMLAMGNVQELIRAHGGDYAVSLENEDGLRSIRAGDPLQALQSLQFQPDRDLLFIQPPDLEQVFLNLTGRQLRE
jgi:ABC-2 type transport system ATP-binding protein